MKKLTLVCLVAMAAFVMTACGNRNAKKAAEACEECKCEDCKCAAEKCEECKCEECKCGEACCAETVVVEETATVEAE